MKRFLATLGIALALFIAVAMVQQWAVFAPWLGLKPKEAVKSAQEAQAREQASETVRTFLNLSAHYYGTGGDRRFAERLPASDEVVDELARDVAFLGQRHRVQVPQLVKVEVVRTTVVNERQVEVTTREYWIIRAFDARDRSEIGPARSSVVSCAYRLVRDGLAWRILAWQHDLAGAAGGQG